MPRRRSCSKGWSRDSYSTSTKPTLDAVFAPTASYRAGLWGRGCEVAVDMRLMIGKTYIGYVVHAWGAQMSAWIETALAVAITTVSAITAVNAGPCAPGSPHNCFNIPARIDFTSVPEISRRIAAEEKTG